MTASKRIGSATGRPMRAATVMWVCVALAAPTALLPDSDLAAVAYLLGMVVIAGSVIGGAYARAGEARRGWRLVAAATVCWLAGDLTQRVLMAVGAAPDEPGPQDVLWLASYPLLLAAVVVMLRSRHLDVEVVREVRLDVLVVTLAGAVAAWILMVSPALEGGTLTLASMLSVLYPLGDVAILAAALILLIAPGRPSVSQTLFVACIATTLVIDSALDVVAPAFPAERLDALLLVANGLLAAAAIHPSGGLLVAPPPAGTGPRPLHRGRVIVLGGALVAVNAVAAAAPSTASSFLDRVLLLLASVVTSGAVVARFYGVVRQREFAEARLAHRAHHDDLTGLANRSLLMERLEHELRTEHRQPFLLTLFYIDLDGFKRVNDEWGHGAGDVVLDTIGARLRGVVRRDDTVARMGGDEFVVMCRDVPADSVERLGQELRAAAREAIALETGDVALVGASIGVVRADLGPGAPVRSAAELIRSADGAMYDAKRAGGGIVAA